MYSIKCERRIYDSRLNSHSHEYGQLILPLQGMLYIETNSKKFTLRDDHLFFLPPECQHTFGSKDRNEFLVLDIGVEMLNRYDMERMMGGREILFDDKWKAIRYLLLNEAENEEGNSSLHNLFYYSYRLIADSNIPLSIKYINNHFTEEIDLKKLADIEHYNTNYYSEWFKKSFGVSPIEYIRNLRIKKAKELLLSTNFTILQIAQTVGYKHNSSFTRIFKDLENITPAEFRVRKPENRLKKSGF